MHWNQCIPVYIMLVPAAILESFDLIGNYRQVGTCNAMQAPTSIKKCHQMCAASEAFGEYCCKGKIGKGFSDINMMVLVLASAEVLPPTRALQIFLWSCNEGS